MNALIESCVKYSEALSSLSSEDDVGMNLLASVATAEMSRSEFISPTDSTERSTPAKEDVCYSDDAKSNCSPKDKIQGTENPQHHNDWEGSYKERALLNGSWPEDGLHVPKQTSFFTDINCRPSHISAGMEAGAKTKSFDYVDADTRSNADPKWEFSKIPTQKTDSNVKIGDGEISKEVLEEMAPSSSTCVYNIVIHKNDGTNVAGVGDKSGDYPLDTYKATLGVEVASPIQSCNIECKSDLDDGLMARSNSTEKITATIVESEVARNEDPLETLPQQIFSEAGDAVKVGDRDGKDIENRVSEAEIDIMNRTVVRNTALERCSIAGSIVDGLKTNNVDGGLEKKEFGELVSLHETRLRASVAHKMLKNDDVRGSKGAGIAVDEVESASKVAEGSSAAAGADPDAKVKFDLNEGLTVDEGKYGEPNTFVASDPKDIQMFNSPQFSVNPNPTLHPASIRVAASAKGHIVPPEDLLRSKGELGRKGSAVTSAFRPAEPRKVNEMPLASTHVSFDASTSKNGRVMLDIDLNLDLNVPDGKVLQECNFVNNAAILLNKSSGSMHDLGSLGLDLDLNRVDESNENGQCSTSWSHNEECFVVHAESSGGWRSADIQRGFDLNDRPGFDDSAEHLTITQYVKVALPSQLPLTSPGTHNHELGSLSSWFLPANNYSTVGIPSIIPDRADQPFPVIPPGAIHRAFGPASLSPLMPETYRGSVLSSSSAVSYPSSPFRFPVFPYGSSVPLSSANFTVGGTLYSDSSSGTRPFAPSVNSQFLVVGSIGGISSSFQRPLMFCFSDNSSNSQLDSSRRCGIQGLDLNSGPGAVEGDAREVNLPHS